MDKHYSQYDYLRCEFFELLIPAMLYTGTEAEKDNFFRLLQEEGSGLINEMY